MIHPAELDTLTVDFKCTQAASIISQNVLLETAREQVWKSVRQRLKNPNVLVDQVVS
jgi:hypothetical protein